MDLTLAYSTKFWPSASPYSYNNAEFLGEDKRVNTMAYDEWSRADQGNNSNFRRHYFRSEMVLTSDFCNSKPCVWDWSSKFKIIFLRQLGVQQTRNVRYLFKLRFSEGLGSRTDLETVMVIYISMYFNPQSTRHV